MKLFYFVMLFIIFLPTVSAEPNLNIEVNPSFNKNIGLFLTIGSSVNYEFEITNTGTEHLTDLFIYYVLEDPHGNNFGEKFFSIPALSVGESEFKKETIGYHLSIPGNYILKIRAASQENDSIPIAGIGNYDVVRHNFIVNDYSIELIISIIALALSFFAVYSSNWKGGRIIVTVPRFYRIPFLRQRDALVIELPLTFINDGANPKACQEFVRSGA